MLVDEKQGVWYGIFSLSNWCAVPKLCGYPRNSGVDFIPSRIKTPAPGYTKQKYRSSPGGARLLQDWQPRLYLPWSLEKILPCVTGGVAREMRATGIC